MQHNIAMYQQYRISDNNLKNMKLKKQFPYTYIIRLANHQLLLAITQNMKQNILGIQGYQGTFSYTFGERRAMSITLLISASKLNFKIVEFQDQSNNSILLTTPYGQFQDQYDIIENIVRLSMETTQQITSQNFEKYYGNNFNQDQSFLQPKNYSQVIPKNLLPKNLFYSALITEKSKQLQNTLFKIVEIFYKYLFGINKTSKIYFYQLKNNLKKQIKKLNKNIKQFPIIYQDNYLSYLIIGKLYLCYCLAFKKSFWKENQQLYNMFLLISKKSQFIQTYGKLKACKKQFIPYQFLDVHPNDYSGSQPQYIYVESINQKQFIYNTLELLTDYNIYSDQLLEADNVEYANPEKMNYIEIQNITIDKQVAQTIENIKNIFKKIINSSNDCGVILTNQVIIPYKIKLQSKLYIQQSIPQETMKEFLKDLRDKNYNYRINPIILEEQIDKFQNQEKIMLA